MQAYAELLEEEGIEILAWFSFNSKDGTNVVSGDPIAECASIADSCKQVVAVGINCTPPRFIHGLITSIRKVYYFGLKVITAFNSCMGFKSSIFFLTNLWSWVRLVGVMYNNIIGWSVQFILYPPANLTITLKFSGFYTIYHIVGPNHSSLCSTQLI